MSLRSPSVDNSQPDTESGYLRIPMAIAFRQTPDWYSSLKVHELESGKVLGQVSDITWKVLHLSSATPLTKGVRYHCRLALPTVFLGHTNILFEADCTSAEALSEPGQFLNTLVDLSADPGDIEALEMLILRFAMKSPLA